MQYNAMPHVEQHIAEYRAADDAALDYLVNHSNGTFDQSEYDALVGERSMASRLLMIAAEWLVREVKIDQEVSA